MIPVVVGCIHVPSFDFCLSTSERLQRGGIDHLQMSLTFLPVQLYMKRDIILKSGYIDRGGPPINSALCAKNAVNKNPALAVTIVLLLAFMVFSYTTYIIQREGNDNEGISFFQCFWATVFLLMRGDGSKHEHAIDLIHMIVANRRKCSLRIIRHSRAFPRIACGRHWHLSIRVYHRPGHPEHGSEVTDRNIEILLLDPLLSTGPPRRLQCHG